jgi:uncharacterized protein (DUF697 family)/tellurite resistance protein
MSLTQSESVASLHVLVAVARADGTLHAEERAALEEGLRETGLLDALSAEEIFADHFDLDEQVALLESPEARAETYRSAYGLAYADGDCSEKERALLAELRTKLGIAEAAHAEVSALFASEAKPAPKEKKSYFQPIADAEARATAVARETRKCAIVSAALGAFPVPGLSILTDLIVVGLQVGLVQDLASMHGKEVDASKAKGLLAGLGLGTGARLAVSSLAKVLPGWGSLIGATAAFASTYAVGVTFHRYFEGNGQVDEAELGRAFADAKREGEQKYAAEKATIESETAAKKAEVAALVAKAKSGELDAHEAADKLAH